LFLEAQLGFSLKKQENKISIKQKAVALNSTTFLMELTASQPRAEKKLVLMYHPDTPEKLMKGWTTRKSSPLIHLALSLSVILVNEQGNFDLKNQKNQNK